MRHLPWLMPEDDEPLAAYADRMRKGIADDPILLGLSFGGMMSIEIAKYYPAATVILLSSIRNHEQRQGWMTLGEKLHFDRWLSKENNRPNSILRRWTERMEDYYLGVESDADARLVSDYRNQTDRRYLRWAVARILQWENRWTPPRLYQLHGGQDRIFRLPRRSVTHYVPDGGHLMAFNRPKIVSSLLRPIFENGA